MCLTGMPKNAVITSCQNSVCGENLRGKIFVNWSLTKQVPRKIFVGSDDRSSVIAMC